VLLSSKLHGAQSEWHGALAKNVVKTCEIERLTLGIVDNAQLMGIDDWKYEALDKVPVPESLPRPLMLPCGCRGRLRNSRPALVGRHSLQAMKAKGITSIPSRVRRRGEKKDHSLE
jgi:hypothetical protein